MNWIDPITESPATEKHHIFAGRFRKLSEEFGFYVYVTRETHIWAQRYIIESGKKFAKILGFNYNKVVLALNKRDIITLMKQGKKCQEGLIHFEY